MEVDLIFKIAVECPAFRTLPNGERLSDWLGCAEALIR